MTVFLLPSLMCLPPSQSLISLTSSVVGSIWQWWVQLKGSHGLRCAGPRALGNERRNLTIVPKLLKEGGGGGKMKQRNRNQHTDGQRDSQNNWYTTDTDAFLWPQCHQASTNEIWKFEIVSVLVLLFVLQRCATNYYQKHKDLIVCNDLSAFIIIKRNWSVSMAMLKNRKLQKGNGSENSSKKELTV